MNRRSSASARVLAAAAVAGGFLVVIVVISASLGGGGSGHGGGSRAVQHRGGGESTPHTPKAYVVQSGDTLTSIARKTGVSVARIRALNPGIDPQILISGETLKLK
jgi:LysM repeat protein